jgi:hypothetical protein
MVVILLFIIIMLIIHKLVVSSYEAKKSLYIYSSIVF